VKGPVLVLDALNGIGRGLVQAVVDAGRPVIAVSRDRAGLALMQAQYIDADFTTVRGSVDDEHDSAALAQALHDLHRPIAGMLISRCHEQARGRMLDQPGEALKEKLDNDLLPQLAAARQLLPLLAASGRNGSYVIIGGPGSENPWAGYGHHSVCAAALNMLVRVLHDEARALSVRVQLLAVDTPARTIDNEACACEQWPSAVAIGTQALALVDQADPTQAVQAIVRYATPNVPRSRRNTAIPNPSTRPITHGATSAYLSPTNAAPLIDDPDSKDPQRYLDDTWALLKPLLSASASK